MESASGMVQSQRRGLKAYMLRLTKWSAEMLSKAGWCLLEPQERIKSPHLGGSGSVQNLRQLLQHLAHSWPSLGVVEGGEGAGSHARLDLLQASGDVHGQEPLAIGDGKALNPMDCGQDVAQGITVEARAVG